MATTSDLLTAKQQVATARSQLASERQKAEQQRELLKKSQEQLREAETKLPQTTSQRALRQTMGGIQGLIRRRQISKTKQKIQQQQKELMGTGQKIREYEGKISEYETEQIKPVEAEIQRVEEYNRAVETIQKAAAKGTVGLHAIYDTGLVKELAQDYVKKQNLARKGLQMEVEKFQLANPTEKLDVDWKNLQIRGIQSGALGETLSLKEYNKKIKDLQVPEKTISVETVEPINLGQITEQSKVKPTFFQKLGAALTGGIGTASAKDLSNVSSLKVDDNLVSNRSSGGILGNIRSGVTNITSSIMGDKEIDRQKGRQVFTGNVVSEYDPSIKVDTYVPEQTTFQKITSLPGLGLASARQFSSDVASQTSAEQSLGIGNVGSIAGVDVKAFGVPTAQLSQVEQAQIRIKQNLPEIKKLETNINKLGEWTGSQADLNRYNKLIQDYQTIEQNRYYQSGLFGGGRRDITQVDFSRPVSTGVNLFGGFVGGTVTGGLKRVGWEEPLVLKKDQPVYTEQYGTIQDFGLPTQSQFYKETGKIDITISPEEVGKVAGGLATAGLYLTPLGTPLVAGSIVETGAKYNFSPSQFWKGSTLGEKVGLGLDIGLLGGAAALKGFGVVKDKAITKAIQKEINSLEGSKVPLTSFTYINEAKNLVQAKGFVVVDGVRKEVQYVGRLAKTERGFQFIPEGIGGVIYSGVAKPKLFGFNLKERPFISGTEFEIGARGGSKFIRNIGDAQLFEEFGITTIIPKTDFFGVAKGNVLDIRTSVSKEIPIKDITAPIGQRNLFFKLNENLGLRVNPQEVGIVIKVPKPKEISGFAGKGKKSSSKYLDNLYSDSSLKIEAPELDLISKNIKTPVIFKTKTKTSEIFPLVSASEYSGTGMYEQTQTQTISSNLLTIQPQQVKVDTTQNIFFGPVPKVGTNLINLERTRQKNIQSPIGKINLGTRPTVKQPQRTDLGVIPTIRQPTRTTQRQAQRVVQEPRPRPGTPRPKPITPKPKIRLSFEEPKRIKRPLSKKKRRQEEFLAITKRRGKEVVVGLGRTPKEAEQIAKRDVLGKLSATVKVKERRTGRQIQLAPDRIFRASKTDPLALVQRKELRLSAKSERREIKEARRKPFDLR